MATNILGKATRNVADLNAFMKSKGCPEYAQLYRQAGEEFGVTWDLAIFQSMHETGNWKFNGDVKLAQNNFAGIGASGNGAKGDSFPDALTGIRAQLQNLALRAGKAIPLAQIIAPYVAKNYGIISKRGTTTWESLTGTYATDPKYTSKIFAIAAEFDLKYPNSKPETKKPVPKNPTWINLTNDDGNIFIQGMVAGDCISEKQTNSVDDAIEILTRHRNTAKTFAVGKRHGPVLQPEPEPTPTQPNPDPQPVPSPVWVKTEWIPFAKKSKASMKTVEKKWPKYFIIHWTAGEPSQNGEDGIASGAKNGYTYLFLERGGQLWQGAPTTAGGHHTGAATVSSYDCLGVEVACAGKLEKINGLYVPWFAKNKDGSINKSRCIPDKEVIYDNDGPEDDGSYAGYYQKFTEQQYNELVKLALYCVQVLEIKVENIRGHDEIAVKPGRKVDPGFSICDGGMVEFRKRIKHLLNIGSRWDKL
jgi:hypothetical protein